jgi:hypothetical protein
MRLDYDGPPSIGKRGKIDFVLYHVGEEVRSP